MADGVLHEYEKRLEVLQLSETKFRKSRTVAFVATAVAVIILVVCAVRLSTEGTKLFVLTLAVVPVIVYSASIYRRRHKDLLRVLRLQGQYERGIARLTNDWAGTGFRGEEFANEGHRYDVELGVFGEGSLFELLCTCRTEVGRRALAKVLTEPVSLTESRLRQVAIKELRTMQDLREQIQLLGQSSFEQTSWANIADWLTSPRTEAFLGFRAVALLTSATLATLLLLWFDKSLSWNALEPWIGLLLVVNSALGMIYRDRIVKSMESIRAVGMELGVFRQGLSLLEKCTFESSRLSNLVECLSKDNAAFRTRRLERLVSAMTERDKEWFYLPSRALLVGVQVFLTIERWRKLNSRMMLKWLVAWGEFEALMALANYAFEHPDHCYPTFTEGSTVLEGSALGHPLLAAAECVRNDLTFSDQRKLYIVSGSNMAGKSTLLRAIGLNVVLAYAGAPVCAKSLNLSRFAVCASLSIQDSLLKKKSKFLAEIERLKQALSVPTDESPVLFLLDEILSGTNSKDRRAASETIIRALIGRGAVGALSTHDLALTELAALPELCATNVHIGSSDDSNPLNFDYLLKPGVTTQSSAMAIARLAGVVP